MTTIEIPSAFREIFDPQYRDIALFGGRGGGKTHNVAGPLVIQAAQKPLRIVCAREIQNSIRDSSKAVIEDKIKDYGLKGHFVVTDQEIRGQRKANEDSRFLFKGMWRNPDAIKSLEGADVFWGDEANRFSERSIRLVRPTMRKPGSRMIWTWNPEFDHDPIDRLFRGENGPPPRSLVKQVGWEDNPYFKASPLYEEMQHDYAIDHARAAHIWGGTYLSAIDGAYYVKQLDEASKSGRISSVAKDPTIRVRAFWDLGRNDATAIWIAQFVGREIRFLDYIEGRGQEMGYYIEQLRARGWDGCLCVLPHDGANVTVTSVYGSAESILKTAGFEVSVVPNQGKGAALARVEAARRLFPSMWFNADECRPGLKALAAYHERIDDKRNVGLGPLHDWSSDCFARDTRVLTRDGTRQIMDLPYSGEVLTPCGWKAYRNPRITRRNVQLVEVTFNDGHTVKCTPDHLFLTASGWKSAKSLTPDMLIQSSLTPSRSISTAGCIASGLAVRTTRAVESFCTAMLGLRPLARSLTVATFTTRTETQPTMRWTTSNASTRPSICHGHGESLKSQGMGTLTSRRKPVTLPLTGTEAMPVGFGTSAMPNALKAGQNGSASQRLVRNARSLLMRLCERAETLKFTALQSARPLRIATVRPINGEHDAWDITVPDGAWFSLANGAVVHNCADAFGLAAIAYEAPSGQPKKKHSGRVASWMG